LQDVGSLEPRDIRRAMPRFSAASHAANLRLLPSFAALAAEAGCSMAQLALAWVLSRGEHVIAIPGTTSIAHLDENLAGGQVVLSPELAARVDAAINRFNVAGERYNAATQAEIDTEQYSA
jgi:aryl-alcohol dehydrogenase-like predicted oxidoreductase